jgi:hypothetical protein
MTTADKMDKTDDIIRNAAADIAATPPVLRDGGAAMAAAAGADEGSWSSDTSGRDGSSDWEVWSEPEVNRDE